MPCTCACTCQDGNPHGDAIFIETDGRAFEEQWELGACVAMQKLRMHTPQLLARVMHMHMHMCMYMCMCVACE